MGVCSENMLVFVSGEASVELSRCGELLKLAWPEKPPLLTCLFLEPELEESVELVFTCPSMNLSVLWHPFGVQLNSEMGILGVQKSGSESSKILFATSEAIWNYLIKASGVSGVSRNKFWSSIASISSSVARVYSFRSSACLKWVKISRVVRLDGLPTRRDEEGVRALEFVALANLEMSILDLDEIAFGLYMEFPTLIAE